MVKFGQVYAYDQAKGLASIRFSRPEACGKCGACGSGTHQGEITLAAQCAVGDWVRVEMPETRFLSATAIAYVIPLIAMFMGLGVGVWLGGGNDIVTLLGALIGLGLSIGVLWGVERRVKGKPEWSPHITQVYPAMPDEVQIGCRPA